MASIDSLLRLISFKSADALVIVTNKIPLLRKAGESIPLSMPEISADLVETFVEEVVPEALQTELISSGDLTTTYSSDDGERFTAKLESLPDGFKLVFRKESSSPAANEVARQVAPAVEAQAPQDDAAPSPSLTLSPTYRSMLINFCADSQRQGASDIFLSSGSSAHIRVGGVLREAPYIVCSDEQILGLLEPAMESDHLAALEETGSVDLSFEHRDEEVNLLLRVNLFCQEGGLAAALRPIKRAIPSLEELGLPESLHKLVELTSGLVLMTGPAGSGKSTTLAALVEHLNEHHPRHVITLEDPIEFRYENKTCLIHQREVGRHVESFSDGLRAALRESPDVILLGELRDLATIAAALTAAETGHLILSTLHCADAPGAVDRIIDIFPGHQQAQIRSQLAGALRAVLTQTLLPSLTPGLRVPALEKLVVTDAVATKIRESRGHQLLTEIQTGRDKGMVSLERSLAALVRSGRVAVETALAAAKDQASLKRLLGT